MTERNGGRPQLPSGSPSGFPPPFPLGLAKRGYSGVIQHLSAGDAGSALSADELERRLIELGFVEGAKVEVLHEGIVGRDPIAVRVENVTIAVRRREAMAIIVA
jgi:ferrous iron transport protein A